MFSEILFDALFELFLGGAVTVVCAILCMFIEAGKAIGRVTHITRNSTATERRAIDIVDALLFPDEH
jgi:hypothetical protein